MILNYSDMQYVTKKIKDKTGVEVVLNKVHIDNVVPVTEENRQMFLDSVVDMMINISNGTAEEFEEDDIQYQTINSYLDGE